MTNYLLTNYLLTNYVLIIASSCYKKYICVSYAEHKWQSCIYKKFAG